MTLIAFLGGQRDHIVKRYQGEGDFKVLQAPIGDLLSVRADAVRR